MLHPIMRSGKYAITRVPILIYHDSANRERVIIIIIVKFDRVIFSTGTYDRAEDNSLS